MSKILFICKKHYVYGSQYNHGYGIFNGLFNSASFVANFLNDEGHEAKVAKAIDGNCVDRLVTEFDPDIVIIEALWVTPEKMHEILNIRRHQRRRWIIRIHSKIPFLANEGIAFSWLWGYRHIAKKHSNFFIAPNSPEATDDLTEALDLRTIYLPNIYCPKPSSIEPVPPHDKNIIDIGCFGAIRPMKNNLNQAIAAVRFANEKGKKLRFHVNAGRTEQRGDQILKNLQGFFNGQKRHVLVEHAWLNYDNFIQLVCTMDMGMQVSFSETFNIVAADFVSHDLPLVGSTEIPWLPKMFCADPNSTTNMAERLNFAWTYPGYLLRKVSLMQLNRHLSQAKWIWLNLLQ
jgi:hypothetical protein